MNFELLIVAFCGVVGSILTLDLVTFIVKPSAERVFNKFIFFVILIVIDTVVVYYILNGCNLF